MIKIKIFFIYLLAILTFPIMATAQDGNLILQGLQNGRAWNMVISETTGVMTATVAAEVFSFMVFGACIAQSSTEK